MYTLLGPLLGDVSASNPPFLFTSLHVYMVVLILLFNAVKEIVRYQHTNCLSHLHTLTVFFWFVQGHAQLT